MRIKNCWAIVAATSILALSGPRLARACATNVNNSGTTACSQEYTSASYAVGVYGEGEGTGGAGVEGYTATSSAFAVTGVAVSGGTGVAGNSDSGYGGYFLSTSGKGVYASSSSQDGIYGTTLASGTSTKAGVKGLAGNASGYGVVGENTGNGFGVYGVISPAGQGYAIYGDNNSATGGAWAGFFVGSVNIDGSLFINGVCNINCPSDRRLKTEVEPLTGALERLMQLNGVTYKWKNPEEHGNQAGTQTGFIAQDVEKIFPEWVGTRVDGFKTLDIPIRPIVALEVEALRTLKTENDELRAHVAKVDARAAKLEDRLEALEKGTDPATGGVGISKTSLFVVGLGFAGMLAYSRRKPSEKQS